MSDVADRVKKIVIEHLGVDEDKVVENASFIDDLGADSLDTVELVMAFEEEFGCEIPDDAAEKILTIKDAPGFIEPAQQPFFVFVERVKVRTSRTVAFTAVHSASSRERICYEKSRRHWNGGR